MTTVLFKLSGNRLTTNAELDYETSEHHTITVQVTDKDGLTFVQDLLIHVSNGNDAPTGATLNNNEVAENLPTDTEVGTLTASDPDRSDVHTFKITGGVDKALFQIQGDKLLTSASLDYEAKAELEVIVRVTDDSGAYFDVPLSISVTDANDSPTDITLNNDTLAENEDEGTVIGKLLITDPDLDQPQSRFQIITTPLSWHDSLLDAQARGAHLAVITDQDKWDLVQSLDGFGKPYVCWCF